MNIVLIKIIVAFAAGWFTGHENSTVTADCRNEPLIVSECVEIYPPQDDTFGATTTAYINLVGQYRKCKQACEVKK